MTCVYRFYLGAYLEHMFSCLLGLVKIHHAETFVKNALPTHTLASLRRLVHITLKISGGQEAKRLIKHF